MRSTQLFKIRLLISVGASLVFGLAQTLAQVPRDNTVIGSERPQTPTTASATTGSANTGSAPVGKPIRMPTLDSAPKPPSGVPTSVAPFAPMMAPNPEGVTVHQPDGTKLTLHFKGTPGLLAWYEDENGYTVLREEGTYVYARQGRNGEVAPDRKLVVGKVDPKEVGLPRGVRPSTAALERARQAQQGGRNPLSMSGSSLPKGTYTFAMPGTAKPSAAEVGKFNPSGEVLCGGLSDLRAALPKVDFVRIANIALTPHATSMGPAATDGSNVPNFITVDSDGKPVRLIQNGRSFTDENGYPVVKQYNQYLYAVIDEHGEAIAVEGLRVGYADPAKSGLRRMKSATAVVPARALGSP